MAPDAALALCRFLHDASTMLVWGAFAYLSALVPTDLAESVGRRLRGFRIAAILVTVAASAAALPLEAGVIGEGWTDVLNPATVHDVLFDTTVGHAWLVQAVAALLLLATLTLRPAVRLAATAVAAGLVLAALAATGHAAMHQGWLGIAHRLNDAVHVLSGGAWLGALVPLLPILRLCRDPALHRAAATALRRFSNAGHAAVALVIATGVVNTSLVLGRWPIDWTSPYQLMLAWKIALVAVMTAIAVVNRYILVPRMRTARHSSLGILAGATTAELALGAGVIALVSVFGMLEPA